MNEPISDEEKTQLLRKCEGEIKKGQQAFITTARAVLMIRQQKLYRPTYKTASEYFDDKWDMSSADVSRYKNAAEILEELESKGITELPSNEGQCRALHEIDGFEKRVEIWKKVLDSGERRSAKLISKLANPQKPTVKAERTEEEETEIVDSISDISSGVQGKTCSAIIEIEFDCSVEGYGSSAVADTLEYQGRPCNKVAENVYSITINETDRKSLFANLALWERAYALKKITIVFG